MNKKVLTLCAGFMLAGSSFAFAEKMPVGEQISKKDVGSDWVFLGSVKDGKTWLYGQKWEDPLKEDKIQESVIDASWDGFDLSEVGSYDAYLWKVEEITLSAANATPVHYGYKLTNKATKQLLTFKSDGSVDTDYSDNTNVTVSQTSVYFGDAKKYKDATSFVLYSSVFYGQAQTSLDLQNESGEFAAGDMLHVYGSNCPFYFYTVEDQVVEGDKLNELYNSIGFNFGITGEDKVDNIFDKEGVRIKAIQVPAGGKSSTESRYFSFPEGTYFVTDAPAGMSTTSPTYDELMNCTFIAASPSLNDINLAADRKTGKGFQLTTVSGKELNNYVGTEDSRKSQGEDISVYNACFKVLRNSDGNYDLSLAKFRFNEKADSKTQSDAASTVRFAVTPKTGDDHTEKYLTTILSGTPNYYFVYKETNTAKATDFLNESAKAVYTIQFAAGDAEGKYLYTPAYNNNYYAKGAAFVDTNMPEAQWIITDVKTADNTIEFTNRANNSVTFTTKLYKESDGSYTMALDDNTKVYYDLNVNNDGDIAAASTKQLHASVVELKQVTTDKFAGTWNVADGTEVTMLFARDATPTSNKLYVQRAIDEKTGKKTNSLVVSNKLSNAIQFELVKTKDSLIITNPYAYKVGEVIKYQSKGDTITFYTYKFKAYQDGVTIKDNGNDLYLHNIPNYGLSTAGDMFIIKENVNGSISLIPSANSVSDYKNNAVVYVNKWDVLTNPIEKFEGESIIKVSGELKEQVKANYVKTYLNIEAPETSLSATESYVTIKSDLGNYITMNEDRDGIMASTDPATIRVIATDTEKNIPSFYITTGWNEDGSRMFMFNPSDSVNYYVAEGSYDKKYQWDEEVNKVIFKNATLSGAKNDTLSTEIKGVKTLVADKADNNKKVQGGLDKFKYQIILAEDEDNLYWIRQNGAYLTSINGKLTFSNGTTTNAVKVYVEETSAPTANESINAANNVVVAGVNGAVVVKGAEGKNVIVSTILGKVVANEVVSSDNATIAAPQGVVVVSVDGESFKVVVK